MTQPHVFVETNLLLGVVCMPSKRHRDALTMKAQFGAGEVQLHDGTNRPVGDRYFEGIRSIPIARSV
jgi:hypothetical protein